MKNNNKTKMSKYHKGSGNYSATVKNNKCYFGRDQRKRRYENPKKFVAFR